MSSTCLRVIRIVAIVIFYDSNMICCKIGNCNANTVGVLSNLALCLDVWDCSLHVRIIFNNIMTIIVLTLYRKWRRMALPKLFVKFFNFDGTTVMFEQNDST